MGFDVFTTKCEAHNHLVPSRSSCPVCVSAKRSQLHASNLAHMPRYLFEQQLDIKSTPQGTPIEVPLTADKPCDVRWKVNFKSNYLAHSYANQSSTTQALLMALDVTTDARLLHIRKQYQEQESAATSRNDQERLEHNMAIDMYHEIVRISKGRIEDPERVTGEFVAYFKLLYGNGQRLIVNKAALTVPTRYVLNFPSRDSEITLNSTTRALLRKLDKYEDALGPLRMKHQKIIGGIERHLSRYYIAVKAMAKDLWDSVTLDGGAFSTMKVRDQFLAEVEYSWSLGQRLTEIQAPFKYRLTMRSCEQEEHCHLLPETQEAFRVLELGIPEICERWYCLLVAVDKGTTTTHSVAHALWDMITAPHDVRQLKNDQVVRVRGEFVERFKYLYNCGQRCHK